MGQERKEALYDVWFASLPDSSPPTPVQILLQRFHGGFQIFKFRPKMRDHKKS
jgi:hypothetical protein